MRKWAVFWAFGGVGCGFGALVVIHWPISACRQCGGLPPAAYFSRPGKVGKSGLRASPRDPSGARTPCGGSALRLWTMDVTKAGQGQEKPASIWAPTGVLVLLYDKDAPTVARCCLPILGPVQKPTGWSSLCFSLPVYLSRMPD